MTTPPSPRPDSGITTSTSDLPPDVPPGEGDMTDTPAEIAFWAPIPLAACAPINELFVAVDREALVNQRWHRVFTLLATLCGGSALLIGVWNYDVTHASGTQRQGLAGAEFALVVALVVLIGIGVWQQRKNRWLLNRHKAELLRLLKFEFLTTPSAWSGRDATGEQWIAGRVQAIAAVRDRRTLQGDVSTARIAEELPPPPDTPSSTLLRLVEFYLAKRLNPQREYLANRAQRNAFWDGAVERNINTTLFFMSVAAIAAQAVFILRGAPDADTRIVVTTIAAASLPVIASVIRTMRSAFEFSRNRSRFLSAHDALSKLEQRLTHFLLWARTAELTPAAKATILREFERCETQLRTEHYEWLRLMLDAEWFG